jgi:hypothetical protein
MCSYTSLELHQRRYEVIFWCVNLILLFMDLFCFFVVLVGLLGLAYASFLFMRIILLFMFTCRNLLVKSPLGDVSEKPIIWGC